MDQVGTAADILQDAGGWRRGDEPLLDVRVVDEQDRHREAPSILGRAHHEPGPGVSHQEGDPPIRVAGIDRLPDGPGLHHREQHHDGQDRSLQAAGHDVLRLDPGLGEKRRPPVREAVQLHEGDRLVTTFHRYAPRAAGHLGAEQLRERCGGRAHRPGLACRCHLLRQQDDHVREPQPRIGGDVAEQPHQPAADRGRLRVCPQVGGELEDTGQAGRDACREVLCERQGKVDARRTGLGGGGGDGSVATSAQSTGGRQGQCDLEERVAARDPGGLKLLHDGVKQDLLVPEGGLAGLPHSAQQLFESRIAGEIRTQDDRVAQRARIATRGYHAHRDVIAGAETVQQGTEPGLEHREQAGAGPLGERIEPGMQVGADLDGHLSTPPGAFRTPGVRGR